MDADEIDKIFGLPHAISGDAVAVAAASLATIKAAAVATGDEAVAKWCWTREEALIAHQRYQTAFGQIKGGSSYDGWCTLEQAEITLKLVRRHLSSTEWQRLGLDFLATHIQRWQSLFPYKVFISPEIVHHEKQCTICGQVVHLRSGCEHRKGEIYQGRQCQHLVTKPEFVGISFVDKPVQKYSVAFTQDPVTGAPKDHYNYGSVQYVARGLRAPYDGWVAYFAKARHPHSRYEHVGRNDACPCESGLKYEKCCLPESGVLRPHIQIEFELPPESGFSDIEYVS